MAEHQSTVPKYLDEPDLPLRKVIHWASHDAQRLRDGHATLRLEKVIDLAEGRLGEMLASDDPKLWERAMRTLRALETLKVQSVKADLDFRARIAEAHVNERLGTLRAEERDEPGATAEQVNHAVAEALRELMSPTEDEAAEPETAPCPAS